MVVPIDFDGIAITFDDIIQAGLVESTKTRVTTFPLPQNSEVNSKTVKALLSMAKTRDNGKSTLWSLQCAEE